MRHWCEPKEKIIKTHATLRIIREEHASLAALLRSMEMMIHRGRGDEPHRFFDVLRAMLFYIDEFPERLHHPKESDLLFPRVVKAVPSLMPTVAKLERDHMDGEKAVRELQHLLLAWELLGEPRKLEFANRCSQYVEFYLQHMRIEESVILPEAEKSLTDSDWLELDASFSRNADPLTGQHAPQPGYEKLFTRIVMTAPAPIGLGEP